MLLQIKITVIFEYILKCIFFSVIKAEFSASLLQSSVSHDPSEIILICWFAAQGTFLIIIIVENSCSASYFCKNCNIYFLGLYVEQGVKKNNICLK